MQKTRRFASFIAAGLLAAPAAAQVVGMGTTQAGATAQLSTVVAKVLTDKGGLQVRPQPMAGVVQYAPLVNDGEIEFGVSNIVEYAYLVEGKALVDKPNPQLRLVARLVPWYNGLVVKADSPIKSVKDLRGQPTPAGFTGNPLGRVLMDGYLANAQLQIADTRQVLVPAFPRMFELFKQGQVATSHRHHRLAGAQGVGSRGRPGALPELRRHPRRRRGTRSAHPRRVDRRQSSPSRAGRAFPAPTKMLVNYDYVLFARSRPGRGGRESRRCVVRQSDRAQGRRPDQGRVRSRRDGEGPRQAYHAGAVKAFQAKGLWRRRAVNARAAPGRTSRPGRGRRYRPAGGRVERRRADADRLLLYSEQLIAAMIGFAVFGEFLRRPKTRARPVRDRLRDRGLVAGVGSRAATRSSRPTSAPRDRGHGARHRDDRARGGGLPARLRLVDAGSIFGLFLAYALFGHHFAGIWQTKAIRFERLIAYLALDTSSLLGPTMIIVCTTVLVFMMFGRCCRCAAAASSSPTCRAPVRPFRGGTGKVEVVASAFFGSISGSAMANVMSTGIITIPNMKRAGYKPETAAAVEAVSSTGGQIVPPVMGAAAFLMAENLAGPLRRCGDRGHRPGRAVLLLGVRRRSTTSPRPAASAASRAASCRAPARCWARAGTSSCRSCCCSCSCSTTTCRPTRRCCGARSR